ncbi:MAG: hypothetical protein ACYCX4_04690 [Bacillota bacterium]
MAKVERLIEDIKELGMPVILINNFGFVVRIDPTTLNIEDHDILYTSNDVIVRISTNGQVELQSKHRPDNYIIECKRCYNLRQIRTDEVLAEIFWVK